MKIKRTALLLALLMLLCSACSAPPAVIEEPQASPTAEPVERTESIVIGKDTLERLELNISVMSRKMQIYNVTENADGSCTVHMTPEEREAIISSLRTALDDEMDTLVKDGVWPFLEKVKISEDATKVFLYTSEEKYDSVRDRTCADAIYLPSLLYAAFAQPETAETFSMQFTVMDKTEKRLDFFVYPEKKPELTAAESSAENENTD